MKTISSFFYFIFFLCAMLSTGCDDSGGGTDGVVNGSVPVSSVVLNEVTKSMKVDETFTLAATVEPANADNLNVSWSSSNENVATVSGGQVAAVADGTTDITVTTEDGSKTDVCTVTVTKRDVYVAGRLATNGETEVDSGYWKNGTWNNYGTALYYVYSIAVDSGTVYLCGNYYSDTISVPAYATGTTPVTLSRIDETDDGHAEKIVVQGGTVYCCGNTTAENGKQIAALWINGTRTDLTSTDVESYASDILVNGTAIYIEGNYTRPEDGYGSFGYWYRADSEASWQWVELARETDESDWGAYGGIALNGTDVYVGGADNYTYPYACYWLNGGINSIHEDGLTETNSYSITCYRDELFLAGTASSASTGCTVAYWTEASGWELMPVEDFSFVVNGIQFGGFAVSGNDIYLAGSVRNDATSFDSPYIWENGTASLLSMEDDFDIGNACGMCLD